MLCHQESWHEYILVTQMCMYWQTAAYAAFILILCSIMLWCNRRCCRAFIILVWLPTVGLLCFRHLASERSDVSYLVIFLRSLSWLHLQFIRLLLLWLLAILLECWICSIFEKLFNAFEYSILSGQQLYLGIEPWLLSTASGFGKKSVILQVSCHCSRICIGLIGVSSERFIWSLKELCYTHHIKI